MNIIKNILIIMVRFKNRYLLCEYWNDDKDLS